MCNPVTVMNPGALLARGTYLDYEYEVTISGDGAYRCGYIRVPPGHPWHGRDAFGIDAWVHGGLDFSKPDMDCGKGGEDNAWWLGFHTSHAGDAPDPDLPGYLPKLIAGDELLAKTFARLFKDWTVRTTAYVIEQCHRLIDQAADAKAGRANQEVAKMSELRELAEKMLDREPLEPGARQGRDESATVCPRPRSGALEDR